MANKVSVARVASGAFVAFLICLTIYLELYPDDPIVVNYHEEGIVLEAGSCVSEDRRHQCAAKVAIVDSDEIRAVNLSAVPIVDLHVYNWCTITSYNDELFTSCLDDWMIRASGNHAMTYEQALKKLEEEQ